jgi:hypothetical protein
MDDDKKITVTVKTPNKTDSRLLVDSTMWSSPRLDEADIEGKSLHRLDVKDSYQATSPYNNGVIEVENPAKPVTPARKQTSKVNTPSVFATAVSIQSFEHLHYRG